MLSSNRHYSYQHEMTTSSQLTWVEGIEGDFPLHHAVVRGTHHTRRCCASTNSNSHAGRSQGSLSRVLGHLSLDQDRKDISRLPRRKKGQLFPKGNQRRFTSHLISHPQTNPPQLATGQGAQSTTWGEHHSATTITSLVPALVPNPIAKGAYHDDTNAMTVFFYLQQFHNLDTDTRPDPAQLASSLAALHRKSSPNGLFGYPVPTGGGILTRTVTWERSWAVQFTHQLKDVISLDNQANGYWAEFDAVCTQVVEAVIPRLLGALQSDGRRITPTLIHGDLWEGNVAIDTETGRVIAFDPGCVYAHNEAEFGGWRCGWATWFRDPVYIKFYWREIGRSEPVGEWDDRNRLYAVRAMLCESAGHRGVSRGGGELLHSMGLLL